MHRITFDDSEKKDNYKLKSTKSRKEKIKSQDHVTLLIHDTRYKQPKSKHHFLHQLGWHFMLIKSRQTAKHTQLLSVHCKERKREKKKCSKAKIRNPTVQPTIG